MIENVISLVQRSLSVAASARPDTGLGDRADRQQEGSVREEMIESVIYKFKVWLMNVSACEPWCGVPAAIGWASLRLWAILRLWPIQPK
jgi:hypothetical protein